MSTRDVNRAEYVRRIGQAVDRANEHLEQLETAIASASERMPFGVSVEWSDRDVCDKFLEGNLVIIERIHLSLAITLPDVTDPLIDMQSFCERLCAELKAEARKGGCHGKDRNEVGGVLRLR